MLFGKFVVSLHPVQTLLRYPELRRGQCLLLCPGVCRGIFFFTSNHSAVSGITKKSTGKVLNSGRFLFIFVYTICKSLIINVDCGAGGNRTLVRTRKPYAFYMLIPDFNFRGMARPGPPTIPLSSKISSGQRGVPELFPICLHRLINKIRNYIC
nr:MAG TPA: hypothetical protein [Caudoviricetes sp.]